MKRQKRIEKLLRDSLKKGDKNCDDRGIYGKVLEIGIIILSWKWKAKTAENRQIGSYKDMTDATPAK